MNKLISILLIFLQVIVKITQQQQVISINVTIQYKSDIILRCGDLDSSIVNNSTKVLFYRMPLDNLNITTKISNDEKKFQLFNNSLKIISPSTYLLSLFKYLINLLRIL